MALRETLPVLGMEAPRALSRRRSIDPLLTLLSRSGRYLTGDERQFGNGAARPPGRESGSYLSSAGLRVLPLGSR